MNKKLEYPFQPFVGSEDTVLNYDTIPGAVYFTTDTRKIYLDIDSNKEKIPMGGNVGLFYGKMKLDVPAIDGQEEFQFSILDIIGNETGKQLLKPNVDDLILNSDGCFYKVVSSQGEDIEITLTTKKLTIAGSGGGGGGGTTPGTLESFAVSSLKIDYPSVLYGNACPISFAVKATDDLGDYLSGPVGTYTLYVGKVKKETGTVYGISEGDLSDFSSIKFEEINTIDVGPYLELSDRNNITIEIVGDRGGSAVRGTNIPTTDMKLIWDYDETTVNRWISSGVIQETMDLTWKVSGNNIEKTTYMVINGDISRIVPIATGTQENFSYTLNFNDYNLNHGVHTIELWAVAKIGGQDTPTEHVYKNVLVVKDKDTSTLISVGLFEKELTQYTTTKIPIFIYTPNNENASGQFVELYENGEKVDRWNDIANFEIRDWAYTPLIAGENIVLTVQSGGQEKSINVSVKSIGVKIEEKMGYAFKLKSTDFASNDSVRNWNSNNYTATFSDNFDWINGGLKTESDDEGGHRQCLVIKAGTRMSINYNLWEKNPPGLGKHLKIIFKATNCRDYDATVLTSKSDKQITFTDMSMEYYWLTNAVTNLTYSKNIRINNNSIELVNPIEGTLDLLNKDSRTAFENAYSVFENEVYRCNFLQYDDKDPNSYYAVWYKTSIKDSFNGLVLQAQSATANTNNLSMTTQYCENNYIELEWEVTKASSGKQYMKFWIDGIPSNYVTYSTNDRFLGGSTIEIGSDDCDVCIYLIKLYETDLTIDEHMSNFFADAPNAEEMVRRFKRNDIMDTNRNNEINPQRLAKANPDCLVHIYEVPHIPQNKKDETYPCRYEQYHGSEDAKLYAEGVMIKVQGTSSEKYVVSAANLDTNFNYTKNGNVPSGIIDASTGKVLEGGWSMDGGKAIPVDYFCTKVNVASCENANNAMNQEWYNLFQPYKSVLRCKNANARDTMQFTNGVIFLIDNNKTFDLNAIEKKGNNVFGETPNYIGNAYAKMYSLGQMGNSKNNIHVFHDLENPKECCIEVTDNQTPQQWMVSDNYNKTDAGESEKYFEFRYPDGVKNATQDMINGWNRLVSWFANNDPSPAYNKFTEITTEDQYKKFAINKKTFQKIPTYVMSEDETEYVEIDGFDPSVSTYYIKTDHPNGYTNLKLKDTVEQRVFEPYTFRGFKAENQKRPGTEELWQKDYDPVIKGYTIYTYANNTENDSPYTHDTYEYRMAKMLSECEDYLIMDSVLFHFLFIERHCMIDNVAKNTFWSTEDCQHWSMIKDYDNDTADGNDNNGKFTRTYGMEPLDRLNENAYVFNAHQSVWFNFINGLKDACQYMYQELEKKKITYNGRDISVWNSEDYIWLFDKWQKMIPERCWIEDYQRKYFRPAELYNDTMFSEMIEGGQKKYQRRQFETYQDIYMSSKYDGKSYTSSYLWFRPTGEGLAGLELPLTVYSDCYVKMKLGSEESKNRVKRNTPAVVICPSNNLNNATMDIYPANSFTTIGSVDGNQVGHFAPDQGSFSNASKLKEVVVSTADKSTKITGWTGEVSFNANPLLEKLYIANFVNCNKDLNLNKCPSLVELDTSYSAFTGIELTDGAPTKKVVLNTPTSLALSNLNQLEELTLNYDRLNTLKLNNIDNEFIHTKDIVKNTLDALENNGNQNQLEYKLTKVKWTIDDSSEIDDNNIYILKTLLDTNKSLPAFKDDLITRCSYAEALTGEIDVTADAYSGTSANALALHDKYVNKDKFVNIDLDFESPDSKLYTVTVYNGDGVNVWKRKAISGTTITKTFLTDGPEGAFNPESLEKSPTAANTFTFLKTWVVKDDEGTVLQTVDATSTDGYPINLTITDKNIHLHPNFEIKTRSYQIQVKVKHPKTNEITSLLDSEFDYDTPLETILQQIETIPYADSSDLKLEQVYDFIGYSLSEGSSTKVSESFKVNGKVTLWAIFKLEENVRKVIHPEWFNIRSAEYTYTVDTQFKGAKGVELSPRYLDLKGKITIPAEIEFNGKMEPVIKITGFGATTNDGIPTGGITHVFMEEGKQNKLYEIGQHAFRNCETLVYFDFDTCAVRRINGYAFCRTNLTNTSFGNQLLCVNIQGFNQSIKNHNKTIYIPGSLEVIGANAFSALKVTGSEGSSYPALEIGSESNPSKLDFDSVDSPFYQNTNNKFKSITFYSTIYQTLEGNKGLQEVLVNQAATAEAEITIKYIERN